MWILALPLLASAEPLTLQNDDPVLAALRVRDPALCAALVDPVDLAEKLHVIAESEAAPAWVPLRAAICLAERFADDPRFPGWVTPWFSDPELGGLGVAVLQASELNPLAMPLVEPLARAATGRWGAIYARHLP